jgi:transposase
MPGRAYNRGMSRPFGSASALEQRRRQAVEAVRKGDNIRDVARIIGVAPVSVYRWLKMADRPDGLDAKPHHGPAPRLSSQQQRKLERLLLKGARFHGWANELWTTHRIVELIQRHFGVSFHHDHVGRFLRKRLKWSSQKPKRKARERNNAKIKRWQKRKFPRIVAKARDRGAHVVFLDESGFMLTPTVRRTWAPQGKTPILHSWDRRDRISIISCVTVSPITNRLNFYFSLLGDNINANGGHTVDFLRQLKRQLGNGFTVIWDGSNIHSKSRLVKEYLAEHPEIVAETLPGYAPELNPDEGVWGWTKYGRLANLAAADTAELRQRILSEFATLKSKPELLDSFIQETGLSLAA